MHVREGPLSQNQRSKTAPTASGQPVKPRGEDASDVDSSACKQSALLLTPEVFFSILPLHT